MKKEKFDGYLVLDKDDGEHWYSSIRKQYCHDFINERAEEGSEFAKNMIVRGFHLEKRK